MTPDRPKVDDQAVDPTNAKKRWPSGNREPVGVVIVSMKNLSSQITTVVAVAVALLFLAACSDGDSVEAGDPGDDTPTSQIPADDAAQNPDDADGDDDQVPLGAGPYPVGTLEITITHPDADSVAYTISCLGDTATITPVIDGLNEQTACTALSADTTRSLLVDGPPSDRVCTEIYGGPDEAAITGTLDDQPVDVVIDRSNGCAIDDWDSTLAGVLPAALGVTG